MKLNFLWWVATLIWSLSPVFQRISASQLSRVYMVASTSRWPHMMFTNHACSLFSRMCSTGRCIHYRKNLLSKFAEVITLPRCIKEVPSLSLGRHTDCSHWVFLYFSPVSLGICRDSSYVKEARRMLLPHCIKLMFTIAIQLSCQSHWQCHYSTNKKPTNKCALILIFKQLTLLLSLGGGAEYPLPSIAEVKRRVKLYFYSPSGPSWPILGWPLPLRTLQIYICLFTSVFQIWNLTVTSTKISVFLVVTPCGVADVSSLAWT
jgi:hypothetical protein